MTDYLVISALGTDKPGIINELSRQATTQGCNILDTRMTVLGGEFALLMMVSGSPQQIDALQPDIKSAAESLGLTVMLKRTTPKEEQSANLPYSVQVVALDNPGIVHDIAKFFGDKHINIEEMHTGTYAAAHTGTPMFSLEMTVNIPSSVALASLKDEFVGFCDDKNLDASIEAYRGSNK
ncbi:MAG: glycine cleavage system protein R [Gammaproteobacteria bacterium]|nr:MAG: glycine cleavage system protein R [Gammaproteobacteria bacterium]